MATTTTNLSLRKPDPSDTVNVTLDISNNADLIDAKWAASSPTTQAIGDAASAGATLVVARADHRHGMPSFATPASVGAAISAGSAATIARSDHVHDLANAFGSVVGVSSANANGSAATAARSDHVHGFQATAFGAPVSVSTAIGNGVGTVAARNDHVHDVGANAVTTAALAAGVVTNAKINAEVVADNIVTNGSFLIAQDGTSTSAPADASYVQDQMKVLVEAAGAVNWSQVQANNRYLCRLAVTATNNNKFGIVTPISTLDTYNRRGKTVSLAVRLAAGASITQARIALLAWAGTADAMTSDPISTWNAAGTEPTLVANYSYVGGASTAIVPTTTLTTYKLENLTVPTTANNLAVLVICDDKTTTNGDNFDIEFINLVDGSTAREVSQIDEASEMERCQYYYQKLVVSPGAGRFGTGVAWATTNNTGVITMGRTMRATPSGSVSAAGDFGIQEGGLAGIQCTTLTLTVLSRWPSITWDGGIGAASFTVGRGSNLYAFNNNAWIKLNSRFMGT